MPPQRVHAWTDKSGALHKTKAEAELADTRAALIALFTNRYGTPIDTFEWADLVDLLLKEADVSLKTTPEKLSETPPPETS